MQVPIFESLESRRTVRCVRAGQTVVARGFPEEDVQGFRLVPVRPAGVVELRAFKVDVGVHLPVAHTCSNRLDFCTYTSYEQLRDKVHQALLVEGFALA